MTIATTKSTITEHEAAQVERANASGATPVVFVHGLWLLPSSWDRWVPLFEDAGYVSVTPGWPDDPETVSEAREHPEALAGKGIREIADYEEAIIRRLNRKPVIIGHSFGGLLTMILAGRGLAAASVAISPAPFRGVLPLPFAALRTASVALRNPANWNRAVPLTYDQFRYSFANVVGDLADPLAREHLRVLSGLGDRLGIVGPARCQGHVAGLFEQRDPAVPARRQQPEPVNEDNGCGARGVRALDLRGLVPSDGRLGGCGGHLLLLVSRHNRTVRTAQGL